MTSADQPPPPPAPLEAFDGEPIHLFALPGSPVVSGSRRLEEEVTLQGEAGGEHRPAD